MKPILLFFLAGAALAAEPLPTQVVSLHPVAVVIACEGNIEARSQTEVAAQVAGRILEVRVDAGQVVKKGQILMRIDGREATAAVAAAEAQYQNAKASFERNRRLVEQKFISPAALDKTRADYDAALANRTAAAASQSHTLILAPFSGIIARRHAELGDMAQPGRALYTLYAPSALRATVNVPQSRLRELRLVSRAQVLIPELGRQIESSSLSLLPTVDANTHVAQLRIDLPAKGESLAGLTPGMAVRANFTTATANKLSIPLSAVVRRGELAAVYVQSSDGAISLRQLRLGELAGEGEVEVLAGLADGEKLVTDPVRAGMSLKAGK